MADNEDGSARMLKQRTAERLLLIEIVEILTHILYKIHVKLCLFILESSERRYSQVKVDKKLFQNRNVGRPKQGDF